MTRLTIADFRIGGRFNVVAGLFATILAIIAIGYVGMVAQDYGWIAPPDLTISVIP